MSKLVNKAKSSKLKASIADGTKPTPKKERIVRQVGLKEYPRSYKLDSEIMNTLKQTLDRINGISPKKISEARLVKALIFLSTELDDERIVKALKSVW